MKDEGNQEENIKFSRTTSQKIQLRQKYKQEDFISLKKSHHTFLKVVIENFIKITTGFYSVPYLIRPQAIDLHHFQDPSQEVGMDRQMSVRYSFLWFHSDHHSTFSNQPQRLQIMHDIKTA